MVEQPRRAQASVLPPAIRGDIGILIEDDHDLERGRSRERRGERVDHQARAQILVLDVDQRSRPAHAIDDGRENLGVSAGP